MMKTANDVTMRCKSAHPSLHYGLRCMVCFSQTVLQHFGWINSLQKVLNNIYGYPPNVLVV